MPREESTKTVSETLKRSVDDFLINEVGVSKGDLFRHQEPVTGYQYLRVLDYIKGRRHINISPSK
ncbi:hypothetical protein COY23_02650 [bacterium (Candidatus Torokbacteria) CG_4_10_14_0_2_um_filter_35_8]|nr:MAG: hypothetical protein COY23_02650 [bacterium (Candidatus Torokbacteria) CG_4_10_14_0_2_um_filter_35_8]